MFGFSFLQLIFLIPICAIVVDGVKSLYRMRLRHLENLERLRLGLPMFDETKSKGGRYEPKPEIIDLTHEN